MLYSLEKKRKIILDNYNYPCQQIELEELKKKSEESQVTFSTLHSRDLGCGDILHLLIIKKGNHIEKCLFSGQQSCLITIAATNIICVCLENKNLESGHEIIVNCQTMLEGKKYCLNACPQLEVFRDLVHSPHRLECLNFILRGITQILHS